MSDTPTVRSTTTVSTTPTVGSTAAGLHATVAKVIPGWIGDLEDLGTIMLGILSGLSGASFLVQHSEASGIVALIAAGIAGGLQAVQKLGSPPTA